jgi:outer membrane protein
MRLLKLSLLALAVVAPLGAQSTVPPTLTLEEAVNIAKRNNPTYLEQLNGRRRAENAVRNAYGAFLPTASTGMNSSFRQGKPQFFEGVSFGSNSDILSSSWSLNFNYRLSSNTFTNLRRSQQNEDAAFADATSAEQQLTSSVTQQYLLVLQTAARAVLQDSLIALNQLQLDLAKAKSVAGSATSLDVARAEVAVGQQQVAALRARNSADLALIQLFQNMGVNKPEVVSLTSSFNVTEPTVTLAGLLQTAESANPTLKSLRFRELASHTTYRAAQGGYLPSLNLSAGFGGTSQKYKDSEYLVGQGQASVAGARAECFMTDSLRRGAGMPAITAQCNSIQFTDAQAAALRDQNNQFPFKFTSNPYSLNLGLSFNLFDGFNRETQVQDAAAGRQDARYRVRAEELRVNTEVTSGYTTLIAAYRTFRLQEQNAAAARSNLQLAQERYRVGLISLVDLQQTRSDFSTAETNRIDALYEFHRSFAALENAVGRPLR